MSGANGDSAEPRLPGIGPAVSSQSPDVFDWSDDDVVVHVQPMTAVYVNPRGQLVIRQQSEWNGDPFLIFNVESLPAIIERLTVEYDSWKRDQSGGPVSS